MLSALLNNSLLLFNQKINYAVMNLCLNENEIKKHI